MDARPGENGTGKVVEDGKASDIDIKSDPTVKKTMLLQQGLNREEKYRDDREADAFESRQACDALRSHCGGPQKRLGGEDSPPEMEISSDVLPRAERPSKCQGR